jgi:hypothetical protein
VTLRFRRGRLRWRPSLPTISAAAGRAQPAALLPGRRRPPRFLMRSGNGGGGKLVLRAGRLRLRRRFALPTFYLRQGGGGVRGCLCATTVEVRQLIAVINLAAGPRNGASSQPGLDCVVRALARLSVPDGGFEMGSLPAMAMRATFQPSTLSRGPSLTLICNL